MFDSENKDSINDTRNQGIKLIRNQKYYAVDITRTLYMPFLKSLFTNNVLVQDPLFIDQNIFPYKVLVTVRTLKQLLKTFSPLFFRKNLKKALYLMGQNNIDTICTPLNLNCYLDYELKKVKEDFKVGEIVLLTLDNKYYVIESLNAKKNEAVINSKTNTGSYSKTQTILKVKLNHIKHAL